MMVNKRKNLMGIGLVLGVLGTLSGGLQAASKPSKDKAPTETTKPAEAPAAELAPMDKPLIIVEGVNITARDYANFLQGNPNIVKNAFDSEAGKAEALREMVGIYLMRKAMYAEGLLGKDKPNPDRKELTDAYEELANRHFPRPPKASDEAAYAYYEAHPGEFGIPGMTRVSQILFVIPKNAGEAVKAEIRKKADASLKRLAAGESFAAIAKEQTENPLGKLTSGDIGFVDLDVKEQSWMKEDIDGLQQGQHTEVIEGPNGFEILQLTDVRAPLTSPFANVREQAIKAVGDAAQKKVRDAYVQDLAAKAKIEVVMPNIQALVPDGVFPVAKKP